MQHDDHDVDYSSSLTDLMASVAAVFLLVAGTYIFMSMKEKHFREVSMRSEKNELFKKIATTLELKMENLGARASNECTELDNTHPGKLILQFKDYSGSCVGLGFESAIDTLNENQKAFVQDKISKVFGYICESYGVDENSARGSEITGVNLIGHTDKSRLKKAIDLNRKAASVEEEEKMKQWFESVTSNMPLSTTRAQNVFFEVRKELSSTPKVLTSCVDKLFTVAGKGPTEPLCGSWQNGEFIYSPDDPNCLPPQFEGAPDTEQVRALVEKFQDSRNRRVELVVNFSTNQSAGEK